MTLPTNIQELKKICVFAGCKTKRTPGSPLCLKHKKAAERKSNPEPKVADPRYKDLE